MKIIMCQVKKKKEKKAQYNKLKECRSKKIKISTKTYELERIYEASRTIRVREKVQINNITYYKKEYNYKPNGQKNKKTL